GFGEQVVEVHRLHPCLQVQLGSGAVLVGDDAHPEGPGPGGHRLANAPEADDAQRLPGEAGSHQLLLDPPTFLQRGVAAGDVAGQGDHQPECQLGDRQRVGIGSVDDLDPAGDGGGDVDGVETGAGTGDDPEPLRPVDEPGRDPGGGTDDDGLVVTDDPRQFVLRQAGAHIDVEVGGEDLEAVVGYGVTDEDTGATVLGSGHAGGSYVPSCHGAGHGRRELGRDPPGPPGPIGERRLDLERGDRLSVSDESLVPGRCRPPDLG